MCVELVAFVPSQMGCSGDVSACICMYLHVALHGRVCSINDIVLVQNGVKRIGNGAHAHVADLSVQTHREVMLGGAGPRRFDKRGFFFQRTGTKSLGFGHGRQALVCSR